MPEGQEHNEAVIHRAGPDDADKVGRMLSQFDREFDQELADPETISARFRELLAGEETVALLIGDAPDGFAVLRFRPSYYGKAVECHLAELFVIPERRGRGIGRALIEAAIDFARQRGAGKLNLTTGEDDSPARSLYESLGFTNREKGATGTSMLFYERKV